MKPRKSKGFVAQEEADHTQHTSTLICRKVKHSIQHVSKILSTWNGLTMTITSRSIHLNPRNTLYISTTVHINELNKKRLEIVTGAKH